VRYVIIGNGAAGVGGAEGIRSRDKDGEVTIISAEGARIYSRPLISYLVAGKVADSGMDYRPADFYERNNCKVTGERAAAVDAKGKAVILEGGARVPYDKLLVAAGSSPFVPPFEGLDTVKGKYSFSSLADARALGAALAPHKKALIIGAGLIGLKCAEGISEKVASITVTDIAPRILSSILDEGGAAAVARHIEGKGVSFRLSSSVKRFEPGTAYLESGEAIAFDLLVTAVGVRPNTALLKGVADTDRGIIINARSETSAPDIYAAGDCAQALDASSGESKVMALLPNAYMQGECAGVNMAGGEKSFDKAVPMNAVGFFGLHIITAGNYTGNVRAAGEGDGYKRLFYSDNRLNGYIMVGDVGKAGIYTSLLRDGTPLDTLDFEQICEKPGLMAFTSKARQEKLGEAR
jgi:NAD(P)H-nitrite reductase large subunit